ncbi:Methylphloroacetophenone synthase [Colletotrichum sp. SAR 10_96]|nr:Methylphloroacetophenone synthase [Colletotrichum sp. SAR 10_96]
MKAPVVLTLDEKPPEILLSMRRVDNSWPSWVFSITVEPIQKAGEDRVEAEETTTGMVLLRERNDPRVTQEFSRFESLIGDCRWQNIMEHPNAEAMQGKHIYRAFQGVVQYSDAFKGIKAIASLGTEAAGVVRISPDSHGTLDQRLVDTPMIDSFLQFGGFLVNYFSTTTTPDSLLVCHRIQRLQLGPALSPDVKDWLVLANMTPENDENVSVDVYVSEAQTKKMVLVAFGGTTRHVVDLLVKVGIPFEYHFTDLSASLVQKAKTSFAGISGMTFGVLDIESEPTAELTEAFHVIISTNCIHATRNITSSLANLRKMLREDGALALIEMTPTRQLYVFDIIVGLLEGWWLFNDGRSHALADAEHWQHAFLSAGFAGVQWSDGESLEAKTVRVICGFQKPGSARLETGADRIERGQVEIDVQEMVYKTVGSQQIHADIYYPQVANPAKKMPIALMIHGGSHIIFSRKDIRPPQTRIMIDMGLLPVSLDHRLCPESRLADGPMVDVCDALEWAQKILPYVELRNPDVRPDPDNIVVVGWSSGGQLALSTGWMAPERGLRPPNAILAFYCPTDYEDDWWQSPIQPVGAEDLGEEYDVLEAVQDEPVSFPDYFIKPP